MNPLDMNDDFFNGLRALVESAFPKRCASCGREFLSAEQFVRETQSIRQGLSGLKQSSDDEYKTIVEMYRNCSCGSTLMDFFSDRRDLSAAGQQRREKFGQLLEYLINQGWSCHSARKELFKVLHGEKSELLLDQLKMPGKPTA